ncbi:hypothetical protein VTH82DRAFT_1414 [Thermothelomyces myriococcoides]
MYRNPERLYPTAWAGAEGGYRPPTPYPGFEDPEFQSQFYEMPPADSWVQRRRPISAARYRYSEILQRRIDEQNAKIARRTPRASGRSFEPKLSASKRVRFSLPALRRDKDELDDLVRELAKLSIWDVDVGPGRRRCSRCGQRLR